MIKLGITGSIGSGKTLITNIIKKIGIPTFCADEDVKNIYLKNSKFKKKLFQLEPALKNSKSLKKDTAKIALNKKKLLKKIENIIHPIVRNNMKKFIKKK